MSELAVFIIEVRLFFKGGIKMNMKWFYATLIFAVILVITPGVSMGKRGDMVIGNDRKVSFDYTLTVDGKVVETSKGQKPIEYTQGKKEIIPGLESKLLGMRMGEEKTIVVPPEGAYGIVDPSAFKEITRSSLPTTIDPKVDMLLQMKNPEGKIFIARIAEIKKDSVVMDFNHPLAGKTLYFQVKVISIQ